MGDGAGMEEKFDVAERIRSCHVGFAHALGCLIVG
jgi:hypothetical protein